MAADSVADLRAILAKDDTAITRDDITRSYELYQQLGQLDEPRIQLALDAIELGGFQPGMDRRQLDRDAGP